MKRLTIFEKIFIFIMALPIFIVIGLISFFSYLICLGKDKWIKVPVKFYLKTWYFLNSTIINHSYTRIEGYVKSTFELSSMLKVHKPQVKTIEDVIAIKEMYFPMRLYKNDPFRGFIDWTSTIGVQWFRMHILNEIDDSFDCDDQAENIKELLIYYKIAPEDKIKKVAIVSKIPFLKMSHSFVIIETSKEYEVLSPYHYLGAVKTEDEIIKKMEEYFNLINYYNFLFIQ
jgi:hypothetical protein